MRILFAMISLILCCSCHQETQVENTDPYLQQTSEGWIYKGQPFSGCRVEKDRNGKILFRLHILEGKEEGIAMGWYNTGVKLLVRNYKKGKQEGKFEQWWPNGKYRYIFNYREGQMDGTQRVFFPDGQIRQLSNFIKGKEEGRQQVWNKQRELVSNFIKRNNRMFGFQNVRSCLPTEH